MRLDDEAWAEIRRLYETTAEPQRRIAARFGICHSTLSQRALREGWGSRPKHSVLRTVASPKPADHHTLPPRDADGACTAGGGDAEPPRATVEGGRNDTRKQLGAEGVASAGLLNEPGVGWALSLPQSLPAAPQDRALQLLRLIDLQLHHMEIRMTTGEPMTAQDQERQARAMGVLASQSEILTAALSARDMTAKDQSGDDGRETGCGSGPNSDRNSGGDAFAEAQRIRREIAERLERLHAQRLARPGSPGAR